MINVYASVDGRDLGAVSAEVFKQVRAVKRNCRVAVTSSFVSSANDA